MTNKIKKLFLSIFFLFSVIAGLYFSVENAQTKTKNNEIHSLYKIQTTVTRVVDGDTVIINSGEKVRLIGLNTPETVDPRKSVECFGEEASDEAKKILTGQSVQLETDPSQDKYDKYGRLLAYVFLSDGTNFNRQMIENGYGYEYTYHLPYKYQKEFKQAEKEAREKKKGLWADGVCKN